MKNIISSIKKITGIAIVSYVLVIITSWKSGKKSETFDSSSIIGTWELISSESIENNKVTSKNLSNKKMIKIINSSHFAFFNHDLNSEIDSLSFYTSGGGKYELIGNKYIEYLEYCSSREWEGNKFEFQIQIEGNKLTQKGTEKLEKLGINRKITEVYLRISK